jgi:cell division protein ZapA
MNKNTASITVEILGKPYIIRCQESEAAALQQAAQYLDTKMTEVKELGAVINLEKIAVITALNIASQYLQSDQQKNTFVYKLNQRIGQLQEKLDTAISKTLQTEFVYSSESQYSRFKRPAKTHLPCDTPSNLACRKK